MFKAVEASLGGDPFKGAELSSGGLRISSEHSQAQQLTPLPDPFASENLHSATIEFKFEPHGITFMREAQNGRLTEASVLVLRDKRDRSGGQSCCDGIREIVIESYDIKGNRNSIHFELNDRLTQDHSLGSGTPENDVSHLLRQEFSQRLLEALQRFPLESGENPPSVSLYDWGQALQELRALTALRIDDEPLIVERKYRTPTTKGEDFRLPAQTPLTKDQIIRLKRGENLDSERYGPVAVEKALSKWLHQRHVDFSEWGQTPGTKGISQLAKEIMQGESKLYSIWDPNSATQTVVLEGAVVSLDITRNTPRDLLGKEGVGSHQQLVEARVITHTDTDHPTARPGRVSLGGYPGEKVMGDGFRGEGIEEAVLRAMREEPGFGRGPITGREVLAAAVRLVTGSPFASIAKKLSAFLPEKMRTEIKLGMSEFQGLGDLALEYRGAYIHETPSQGYPGIFERRTFHRYHGQVSEAQEREVYYERSARRTIEFRFQDAGEIAAKIAENKKREVRDLDSKGKKFHRTPNKPRFANI